MNDPPLWQKLVAALHNQMAIILYPEYAILLTIAASASAKDRPTYRTITRHSGKNYCFFSLSFSTGTIFPLICFKPIESDLGSDMARYRIDLIDHRGHACLHANFFQCSDAEAIEQALTMFPTHHIELWDADRLVLRNDPTDRGRAAKQSGTE